MHRTLNCMYKVRGKSSHAFIEVREQISKHCGFGILRCMRKMLG